MKSKIIDQWKRLQQNFQDNKHPYFVVSYWLITGVGTYSVLLLDFGYERAWKIAETYQNLFLFPLALGWFVPLILFPVLQFVLSITRKRELPYFFSLALLVPLVLVIMNFQDEQKQIWEINRESQEETFALSETEETQLFFYYNHHESILTKIDSLREPHAKHKAVEKERIGARYLSKIDSELDNYMNWSMSRYYFLIPMFLTLVLYISLLLSIEQLFRYRHILKTDSSESRDFAKSIERCIFCLTLVILWVLYRIRNLRLQEIILGGTAISDGEELIVIISIICLIVLLLSTFWKSVSVTMKVISSIIATAVSIFTIFKANLDINNIANQATTPSAMLFYLLFFLLSLPIVVFPSPEDQKG